MGVHGTMCVEDGGEQVDSVKREDWCDVGILL